MPRQVHLFDPPDRFVAGTVGQPGERTFYLQATSGRQVVSVALEKVQVAALAERVGELLDEIRRREGAGSEVPATAPAELEDVAPLEAPVLEEFRVGTLAMAWDDDDRRLVIEAHGVTAAVGDAEGAEPEPFSDTTEGPDVLRVRLTPRWPARSPSGRCGSSPPAVHPARCAATRSTPRGTSARGRTATGPRRDGAGPTWGSGAGAAVRRCCGDATGRDGRGLAGARGGPPPAAAGGAST